MHYKVNYLCFFLLFKCSDWKLEILYVAHIVFLLDSAILGHRAMGYLNYIQG